MLRLVVASVTEAGQDTACRTGRLGGSVPPPLPPLAKPTISHHHPEHPPPSAGPSSTISPITSHHPTGHRARLAARPPRRIATRKGARLNRSSPSLTASPTQGSEGSGDSQSDGDSQPDRVPSQVRVEPLYQLVVWFSEPSRSRTRSATTRSKPSASEWAPSASGRPYASHAARRVG